MSHSTRSKIPNCYRMKLDGQRKILKGVVGFACVEVTRSSNLICCFCISKILHTGHLCFYLCSQLLHCKSCISHPWCIFWLPWNCITFPCKVRSDLPIYWVRASPKYPMIKLYALLGRDMCTDGISKLPLRQAARQQCGCHSNFAWASDQTKAFAGLTTPSISQSSKQSILRTLSSGIGWGLAGTQTFQAPFRCLNGWDFDSGHKNV